MLLKLIRNLGKESGQVRLFTINWAIYMLMIIVTTVYVYARLDYVRTGPQKGSDAPAVENQQTP